MKTLLFVSIIFIILISENLVAQESSEPLRLNKNFLVHSAGLPEEFLLFVPDSATQILFNPARANNFSSSFVYVNYLSDYIERITYTYYTTSTFDLIYIPTTPILAKGNIYNFPSLLEETYRNSLNPTFSIASLINCGDTKWLLSLTNGINTEESNYNSLSENESNRIYSNTTFNESIYSRNYSDSEREDFVTTLKVSRIWGTNTNFSMGVFGILFNNDYENQNTGTDIRYVIGNSTLSDSARQRRLDKYINNEFYESENSKFAIGIEFSANQTNWDYIGSFTYQKNDNSLSADYRRYANIYDSSFYNGSTQWQVYSFNGTFESFTNVESNPYLLNLNNYFQHSVNWLTSNDNIFISLDGFYSPAQKIYDGMFIYNDNNYNNGVLTSADSSYGKISGTAEGKSWGFTISMGYVLKESLSDINFLTGLRLQSMRSNFDDFLASVGSEANFVELINKNISASITLPLYINYTPADWFSVYGGFNYAYGYLLNKLEYNNISEIAVSSGNESRKFNASRETSDWQSKKSIYLGCELRHHSGLKIQFFFDDNFTSIRDWNVSLGYHF